jgi:hypothetical protein
MNSERSVELADLATFQAAVLDTLAAGGTPEEMRSRILVAAEQAGLVEYVAGFEDPMIAAASELVRKWGARKERPRFNGRLNCEWFGMR